MPMDEPYLHQNSLIMENYNEYMKSINVKPKILTRIFKIFRRESKRTLTSETSNYYLKQVFFMKAFHIFLLINHRNEIVIFFRRNTNGYTYFGSGFL